MQVPINKVPIKAWYRKRNCMTTISKHFGTFIIHRRLGGSLGFKRDHIGPHSSDKKPNSQIAKKQIPKRGTKPSEGVWTIPQSAPASLDRIIYLQAVVSMFRKTISSHNNGQFSCMSIQHEVS